MAETLRKPKVNGSQKPSSGRRKPGSRRRPDPRVMTMTGPFAGAPDRIITLDRARTIADVIRRERLFFRLPTIAVIAGKSEPAPVLRRDWTKRKVRRGEVLTFVTVPAGGGSGNGKQIVGLLASIALAIAAPFAGAAIAGALGFTSALAANVAAAAFLVGGSLLLNAFFTPKIESPKEGESVYSANSSSNRAMPLDVIPVLYGLLRYPPPLAAKPYSEFEGNDSFLYQLHCLSVGKVNPKRWDIGDTLAWTSADGFTESFSDIEIEIIHPGDPITLFPANVVVSDSVSGQTVPDPPDELGPFTVNLAGTEINKIAVDFAFPGGLFKTGDSGGSESANRQLLVEYREIDDAGNPLSGFSTLYAATISRKTRTPQRFTQSLAVPAGRYQARFKALNNDLSEGSGGTVNRVIWAGLRGYLADWEVPEGVTLVATKIRANEQMSQASANEYLFTCQRLLSTYDADTETWGPEVETSSIAWAAADLLRNTDYGLGLADTLYDLDWLVAYDETWGDRDDKFDAIFDRKWIAQDALNAVLRCGRAQAVRVGGRVGFVRAEPKLLKRATFTNRNIIAGSFSRKLILFDEETPDHVVARYLDGATWQEREVSAVISSVGVAAPQEKEYFGITDRDHAWREAIFDAACNAYMREFVSFQTELEGKLLVRGDPVLVQGPLFNGVHAAALRDRDGDTLTIDRTFEPEVGSQYHVILRGKDGKEWGPVLIDSFPADDGIELNPTSRITVEAQHGILEDIIPDERSEFAHVVICKEQTRPFNGLVVGVTADGPRRFSVVAVKDDQRVHLADETEIIPAPYTPPELFSPPPEAPSIDVSSLFAYARNGTVHIELEAGWQPAPGAARYVAQISYDDDADMDPGGASWTPVHDSVATRFTAVILPQAWTLRVAAVGIRQGLWVYVTGTSPVPGLPPQIVTLETLNDQIDAAIRFALERLPEDLLTVRDDLDALAGAVSAQVSTLMERLGQINIGVGARYGENKASAEIALAAAADVNSALAALFVNLFAVAGDGEAEVLIRHVAAALPDGATASYAIEVRATFEDTFDFAGFYIDVGVFPNGKTSRIRLAADQIALINTETGLILDAFLFVQSTTALLAPIVGGEITADLTSRRMLHKTVMTEDAELQMPLGAKPGFEFRHLFQQDETGGRTLTYDSAEFFGTAPAISELALALTVLDGVILDTNPMKVMVTSRGSAIEDPSFTVVGTWQDNVRSFTPISVATGAQAGEIMVVHAAFEDRFDDGPAILNQSGWEIIQSLGGETDSRASRLLYKRLDGTETAPIAFFASNSNTDFGLQVLRITGGFVLSDAGSPEGGAGGGGSLAAQNLNLDVLTAPIIAVAGFIANNNLGSRVFTPTEDASLFQELDSFVGGYQRTYYKIFNTTPPTDVVADWNPGANSGCMLTLGYLKG